MEVIKKHGLKITVHPKKRIEYKEGDILGNNITFLRELEDETRIKVKGGEHLTNIRWAVFRCYCGKEFENKIARISSKTTLSCGCLRDENHKKYIERKRNATKG